MNLGNFQFEKEIKTGNVHRQEIHKNFGKLNIVLKDTSRFPVWLAFLKIIYPWCLVA